MVVVVFEPRPRYIVEVGEEEKVFGGELIEVVWSFYRAFEDLADAEACAVGEAKSEPFVRVIDRGE